ncbi:MAG: hypothetical protein JSR82_14110 [Verrucomicrobia bacterium]|nr:hypothetical protein [Verrucomicrobiota bacterium]
MTEPRHRGSRGPLARYGLAIAAGGILLLGAGWALAALTKGASAAPRRVQPLVAVALPPPPPPPVATPPPPPPQEQKMVEQEKVEENEPKPEEAPKEAPAASTNIKGSGTDGFGLRGGAPSLGGEARRGGNSRWGWYAGQVQGRIASALRSHPRTRQGRFENLTVRIWADATGRITRASLGGSTGDAGLDAALRNEVLAGLQLAEAPPTGMPMPIVLRVNARRPN